MALTSLTTCHQNTWAQISERCTIELRCNTIHSSSRDKIQNKSCGHWNNHAGSTTQKFTCSNKKEAAQQNDSKFCQFTNSLVNAKLKHNSSECITQSNHNWLLLPKNVVFSKMRGPRWTRAFHVEWNWSQRIRLILNKLVTVVEDMIAPPLGSPFSGVHLLWPKE